VSGESQQYRLYRRFQAAAEQPRIATHGTAQEGGRAPLLLALLLLLLMVHLQLRLLLLLLLPRIFCWQVLLMAQRRRHMSRHCRRRLQLLCL
jgi:hypothetical protein